MKQIAILFVTTNSIYKSLPGCDCYDAERDATAFPGGMPVVAHPPCRTWGRLRRFAKAPPCEKYLALWAVWTVRANGGILEHPKASTLWNTAPLPKPRDGYDSFGGFTVEVEQFWWGHRARKATWLYICGCRRRDLPPEPLRLDVPAHVVKTSLHGKQKRRHITKQERSATPRAFAEWLCEVARGTTPPTEVITL